MVTYLDRKVLSVDPWIIWTDLVPEVKGPIKSSCSYYSLRSLPSMNINNLHARLILALAIVSSATTNKADDGGMPVPASYNLQPNLHSNKQTSSSLKGYYLRHLQLPVSDLTALKLIGDEGKPEGAFPLGMW